MAATDPGGPGGLGCLEGLGRSGFVVQEVQELQEGDKIWVVKEVHEVCKYVINFQVARFTNYKFHEVIQQLFL